MVSAQRHANMAAIHSKGTKPEVIVRKWLWTHGFRYRLNDKRFPGHPDVVLGRYKTCIFVNGCFWHGHNVIDRGDDGLQSSSCCKIPHTNVPFWVQKIRRNRERDQQTLQQIRDMGWHSIVVWECELKTSVRETTMQNLVNTMQDMELERKYSFADYPLAVPLVAEDDCPYGKRTKEK